MDFFQHQENARKGTGRLVLLFCLAVIGIIVAVHFLAVGLIAIGSKGEAGAELIANPALIGGIVLITLLLVGGGAAFKISQLSGGGRVVAESLGGRLLSPNTTDTDERRLLNVVEEMAIASGIPMPPVYLMENERGINAFAAGFSPQDAVIGVTRGCVQSLTRDELQGVMAHEFSHILNGDMRLNIRLMGLIFGIIILSAIGYALLRSASYMRVARVSRSSSKGGDPRAFIFLLGGGLLIIGSIGSFFGSMIKAAVSRQREYLADASAVQFTRNPSGIADALKRIAGASSKIASPNAPDASHMFFGQAVSMGFASLFATHPPLDKRIRRIEPSWDGTMLAPRVSAAPKTGSAPLKSRAYGSSFLADAPMTAEPATIAALIGHPTREHLAMAARIMEKLSGQLADAAHDPWSARAVVCAILLSPDRTMTQRQIEHIASKADEALAQETRRISPLVQPLTSAERIALIELASPALQQIPRAAFLQLRSVLQVLVEADGKLSLFEWAIGRVLAQTLESHFIGPRKPRVRHITLQAVRGPLATMLSALAYIGAENQDDAERSFVHSLEPLGDITNMTLLAAGAVSPAHLDAALDALAEVVPKLKRPIIEAAARAVAADYLITPTEFELLRATAAALDCPTPPLLPGQTIAG